MARQLECEGCGLAAVDLPDGVDPKQVFESTDEGATFCPGCRISAAGPSGTWTLKLPALPTRPAPPPGVGQ